MIDTRRTMKEVTIEQSVMRASRSAFQRLVMFWLTKFLCLEIFFRSLVPDDIENYKSKVRLSYSTSVAEWIA